MKNIIKKIMGSKKIMNFKRRGLNVKIESNIEFQYPNNIEIGDNVYLGPNSRYVGQGGICIGSGTIIAHDIEIQTRNHNYDSEDLQSVPYDKRYILKPVVIKENVWIGSHVKIIPGVTVGEGSVIGMGAVVTNDIPPYAVVGGNPAKVIKFRNKEKYLELKNEESIYLKLKS